MDMDIKFKQRSEPSWSEKRQISWWYTVLKIDQRMRLKIEFLDPSDFRALEEFKILIWGLW